MSTQIRTYGGWRERRGFGVGTLSGGQTAAGLIAVLLGLLCLMVVPRILPLLSAPLAVGLLLLVVRRHGESLGAVVMRHGRWQLAWRRGRTRYEAVASENLPAPLDHLRIHTSGPNTVVLDQRHATVTAVVQVEPTGTAFADAQELDSWVTGWAGWLTHLGYIEHLAQVVVTVHTAPRLEHMRQRPAEQLLDRVMGELVAASTGGSAARTLISVTMRMGTEGLDATCLRLQEVVVGMQRLEGCGLSVLPALAGDELQGWIRTCYDPTVDHTPVPTWWDARPAATVEHWDRFQHDSGVSAALIWDECPGEGMPASTLNRLLGPADYVKRVSLVYQSVPAHAAAREVDRQAEAAVFRSQYRRRLGRDETARERLDVQRARQTAAEQAQGSGLVDVGLYAVVTARDAIELRNCVADLHNRAGESRIRLRRAYGGQASCFAATLGVGYLPPRQW